MTDRKYSVKDFDEGFANGCRIIESYYAGAKQLNMLDHPMVDSYQIGIIHGTISVMKQQRGDAVVRDLLADLQSSFKTVAPQGNPAPVTKAPRLLRARFGLDRDDFKRVIPLAALIAALGAGCFLTNYLHHSGGM